MEKFTEKLKHFLAWVGNEFYERVILSWPSTVVAILITVGYREFVVGDIDVTELTTYVATIAVVAGLLYKNKQTPK
jgi:hypothetical protein